MGWMPTESKSYAIRESTHCNWRNNCGSTWAQGYLLSLSQKRQQDPGKPWLYSHWYDSRGSNVPPLIWGTTTLFRGSRSRWRRLGWLAKSMHKEFWTQVRTGPKGNNNWYSCSRYLILQISPALPHDAQWPGGWPVWAIHGSLTLGFQLVSPVASSSSRPETRDKVNLKIHPPFPWAPIPCRVTVGRLCLLSEATAPAQWPCPHSIFLGLSNCTLYSFLEIYVWKWFLVVTNPDTLCFVVSLLPFIILFLNVPIWLFFLFFLMVS